MNFLTVETTFFFLFRLLHPTDILYFRLRLIHWYTDEGRGDVSSLTGPSSAHDSPQAHGTYIDPPILFSSSNSNVSSSHFHRLHYNALIIQTSCMKKHPWITKTLKPHIAIPQARQVSIPILFMSVFSYNISLSHLHRLNSFIDFSIRRRRWSSIHAQRRHWLSLSSRFHKPIKWAWYV